MESKSGMSGGWTHIIARGNNGESIFRRKEDFQRFTSALERLPGRFGIVVKAHALLSTHLHSLVYGASESVSNAMRWLLGNYSRWFNIIHGRTGHLFRNRFFRRNIAEAGYLLEVWRYIHMNPVRAGLVHRPEDYPWSSMREYLNGERGEGLFGCFKGDDWREEMWKFTVARLAAEEDAVGWPRECHWYLEQDGGDLILDLDDPPAPGKTPCRDDRIDVILESVANEAGVSVKKLRSSVRNPKLGPFRGIAALALQEILGLAVREISEMFLVTPGGMESLLWRTRRRALTDAKLRTLRHAALSSSEQTSDDCSLAQSDWKG